MLTCHKVGFRTEESILWPCNLSAILSCYRNASVREFA